MTQQAHGWSIEVAAAGLGMLLSAALLALATNVSTGLGLGRNPLQVAGTSLVTILPGRAQASTASGRPIRPGALTIADVDAIARVVAQVSVMSRVVSGSAPAVSVDTDPRAQVQGVDPAYAQLWSRPLVGGDFFSVQDATAANRVAVLGQTVAMRLFSNGQSPIGQIIRIRNQPFTVVGVLASHASLSPASPDNSVLVPFQTAQVRLFGTGSVYDLVLQVPDASQADLVTGQVQQVLRQRHKVAPGQADDFIVRIDSSTPPPASTAAVSQVLLRVFNEVQQYGCIAKGLCRPGQPPAS